MANKFQVKRTSVSGRTPNTTNSGNTHFIDTGELALNLTDGKMFSSNGSVSFEVGANLENIRVNTTANLNQVQLANLVVSNTVTINNDKELAFKTLSGAKARLVLQSDDNLVLYNTDTTGSPRVVFAMYANSSTSNLQIHAPLQPLSGIVANGTIGSAGQTLTSNGSSIYWSAGAGTGTVTQVNTGNGLTGGPITATGTIDVVANNGIIANSTGVFANPGTGVVVNATGIHVNSSYINTISSNNSSYLGGVAAASYVQNTDSRTLSGNLIISGTYFNPSSNNILLGNSIQRWVISGNSGSFSGNVAASYLSAQFGVSGANLNIAGALTADSGGAVLNSANLTFSGPGTIIIGAAGTLANSSTFQVQGNFTANTLGVYHTGTINAASLTTTNFRANTTGAFPLSNASGTSLGSSTQRWVINANTINASGLITGSAGANITGTANLVDVNISGNLTVSGTTTYVNTTNLNVGDNIITLNADVTNLTAPTENAGLEVNRGSAANVNFLWNETSDSWTLGNTDITGYANATVSVNSALLTVGTSFIANTVGAYHTGTVNAASYTVGSSFIANSTVVTTTGQVTSTRAGSAVDADGQIFLNGATSNRIDWAATGTGAPAVTTRSAGTKLVLYPAVALASVDYGIGVEANHLWMSAADTGGGIKWYANTTQLAVANTTGITIGSGGIFPTSNSSATSLGSATQRWVLNANTGSFAGAVSGITTLAAGNTTITGFANVSTSVNSALLTVGTSFIANTTGAYHTGLVNAASINIGGSGFIANSTAIVLAEPVTANGATGTSGQVLSSNGTTGSPYWTTLSAGLTIGGANTEIQYNNSGALGANSLFAFNETNTRLTIGNTTAGSLNLGRATPSTVLAIQQDKVFTVDGSPVGFYSNVVMNNATLTASRSLSGFQTFTIANTLDANSTGGILNSDAYGHLNYVYNGSTAGANARLNTMQGSYNIIRNFAGGATANSVDAAYGTRSVISIYSSGPITTAYGASIAIVPANTTVTGTITTAYGYHANIQSNTASAIANGYLYYGVYNGTNYTGTAKFGIYITGESNNYVSSNFVIGGNASAIIFRATSDERLKSNIEIINNPVEKIKSVKGVNFTYTSSNTRSIGVIAQDVEKLMPELVDINSEGYRQVNYNGIIGVLIEAVKQQQKEIDSLKQIIEQL